MGLIEDGVIGDFPYAIWFNEASGTHCGYLGVPPGHPWYGRPRLGDFYDVDVHGGVTYTESSITGHKATVDDLKDRLKDAIKTSLDDTMTELIREGFAGLVKMHERHLDREQEAIGEPRGFPTETDADVWWVGFDCNHYWDSPQREWLAQQEPHIAEIFDHLKYGGTFKDRDYVYGQLESMATQATIATGGHHGINESGDSSLRQGHDTEGATRPRGDSPDDGQDLGGQGSGVEGNRSNTLC
jgi:hypothetical protein